MAWFFHFHSAADRRVLAATLRHPAEDSDFGLAVAANCNPDWEPMTTSGIGEHKCFSSTGLADGAGEGENSLRLNTLVLANQAGHPYQTRNEPTTE